mmetsp:Transcript_59558/g.103890  ORF Transcript_59558/g.103890 Transcript_59558/m.103890 type:complete len:333 (-) Transcript_59558:31-1029(-)
MGTIDAGHILVARGEVPEKCPPRLSVTSAAESVSNFADAPQTLIILDWDDTLFPTTELFDRWLLPSKPQQWCDLHLRSEQESALAPWREALSLYMRRICMLSTRVVIVTNSKPGWVENTVKKFAPDLQDLFAEPGGVRVVYASEAMRACVRLSAGSLGGTPVLLADQSPTQQEFDDNLIRAKFHAMQREATEFYSQYPGQTWKNIICVGDAEYEHFAAQDLAFRRRGPDHEKLRLKCIITPEAPLLRDMIYRLSITTLLWPSYVAHDGDMDVDMNTPQQLGAVAQALGMPLELQTKIRHFPISEEDLKHLAEDLEEVTALMDDQLMDCRAGA